MEEIFILGLKLHWQEDVSRRLPILRRKAYVERVKQQDEDDRKALKQMRQQQGNQ